MIRFRREYHPAVWFLYFVCMLAAGMLFMHPVFVAASLLCASAVVLRCCGGGALMKTTVFGLPAFVLIALFNPLISHGGRTPLFYLCGNAFTLEALCFGVCSGAMLLTIFLWFRAYAEIVTPEKFMYLFAKAAPAGSLLVTMTQRMIPLFARRAAAVTAAQRTLLCDMSHGDLKQRFRNGVRITTVLMSWSMEDGLDTADSMKARGYGAGRRTSYARYPLRAADIAALFLIAAVTISCGVCYYVRVRYAFYPALSVPFPGRAGILSLAVYVCLALFPLFA